MLSSEMGESKGEGQQESHTTQGLKGMRLLKGKVPIKPKFRSPPQTNSATIREGGTQGKGGAMNTPEVGAE